MKVITEETLKEILTSRVYPEWVIDCLIRNNLKDIGAIHEENGQIIVDELRPMSYVRPEYGYVLVCPKDHGETIEAAFVGFGCMRTRDNCVYAFTDLHGWFKKPIYRPKDGA